MWCWRGGEGLPGDGSVVRATRNLADDSGRSSFIVGALLPIREPVQGTNCGKGGRKDRPGIPGNRNQRGGHAYSPPLAHEGECAALQHRLHRLAAGSPVKSPDNAFERRREKGIAFCGRRGIAGSLEEARKADSPFWQVLRDRSDYEAAPAAVQANCVRDTCSRWEPHVIPCPGPKNAASRKSDTNRDFGIFRVGW